MSSNQDLTPVSLCNYIISPWKLGKILSEPSVLCAVQVTPVQTASVNVQIESVRYVIQLGI